MIETEEKVETAPEDIKADTVTKIETGVVQQLLDGAKIEKIETALQFSNANELILQTKKMENRLETIRTDTVKPLNGRVKAVNGWFKLKTAKLSEMRVNISGVMITYEEKQKAIAAEEQRKADAAAEKERLRLAEIERKKREEEETKRQEAEALRLKAENEKNEKKREELRQQAAQKEKERIAAAKKADTAAATAQTVVAPVMPVMSAPVTKGRSTRKTWDMEITNVKLLKAHLIKTNQLQYLTLNESSLKKAAALSEGEMEMPGMRVFPKKTTVLRAGK